MFMHPLERVPYFTFEDRELGEDAEKSKELGYSVPKVVTFILITPHGHRGDPIEFIAEEFLHRKKSEANSGRYDGNWVKEFEKGLEEHKQGRELPRSGMPIATWGRLAKDRRMALAKLYPTVEDLAAVPDSSLSTIGLDGRVLRDLARGDIQAKKDISPVVRELAEANETIRRQEEQLAALAKRLDIMEAVADRQVIRSAGRPRKEQEPV